MCCVTRDSSISNGFSKQLWLSETLIASSQSIFCLGAFPKLASALSPGEVLLAWLYFINLKLTEMVFCLK